MATIGDIFKHIFGNIILAQIATKYPKPTISLQGLTYIVTGSNTGLGLKLAIHLAHLQAARIVLAVRNIAKGNSAKEIIIDKTKYAGQIEVWELDMASFPSVVQFANRANKELDRLDGAALNAGVITPSWSLTSDGWERTFQVNALSTGLLALLLLPLLQKTAHLSYPTNSTKIPPHLTITGSGGQNVAKFTERTSKNILEALNDESKFNSFDRYPTSKLFNYFIAQKISKLSHAQGVIVNVVDPGLNHSELARDAKINIIGRGLIQLLAWPASKGALNILYGLIELTPTGIYISRDRTTDTAKWLSTEYGQQVQDQVWQEMLDVWRGVTPEVTDIIMRV